MLILLLNFGLLLGMVKGLSYLCEKQAALGI